MIDAILRFLGIISTRTVNQALAPLVAAQDSLLVVVETRKAEAIDKKKQVVKLNEDIMDATREAERAASVKTKLDELLS